MSEAEPLAYEKLIFKQEKFIEIYYRSIYSLRNKELRDEIGNMYIYVCVCMNVHVICVHESVWAAVEATKNGCRLRKITSKLVSVSTVKHLIKLSQSRISYKNFVNLM